MTKSAPDEGSDYNAKIIKEFRANQGRVDGPWAGTALILIHHIGARSGVSGASQTPARSPVITQYRWCRWTGCWECG